MELQERLELLADLSMAAQGFRPSPARFVELTEKGLMWVYPSKPPLHGLTHHGKAVFISLLCEDSEVDEVALAKAMRKFNPSATEFTAGSAFLDLLEAEARSGTKLVPSAQEALFAVWLVRHLPSQPIHSEASGAAEKGNDQLPPGT